MVSAVVLIVVGVLLFVLTGGCAYVLTRVLDEHDDRGGILYMLGFFCFVAAIGCFVGGIERAQKFEDAAAGFPTAK